ncbi:MAG: hypothetical protein KGH59_00150 [Candidatus Micrarchaeota archaeon]|nr:hypothetical protein [Candidatus Micrarchaeota archaeon]MDE1804185.1 hypothetical protein [Candidatus Micrarchaeota archaeon]MDE1846707.1 hypothetical protein [Candidatus Micrarchaeota archaeon]
MGKLQLGTDENYVFHTLGKKGGPISCAELRKDLQTHGKSDSQAMIILNELAFRHKPKLASFSGDPVVIELTKEGKEIYASLKRT